MIGRDCGGAVCGSAGGRVVARSRRVAEVGAELMATTREDASAALPARTRFACGFHGARAERYGRMASTGAAPFDAAFEAGRRAGLATTATSMMEAWRQYRREVLETTRRGAAKGRA